MHRNIGESRGLYQVPTLKVFTDPNEQIQHWEEVIQQVKDDSRPLLMSAPLFAQLLRDRLEHFKETNG